MDIAFGHTNMDLDCLGSLILVKNLFPGHRLIRSVSIHPAAQNLFVFYGEYFDFLYPREISGEKIDNIIIVDTCTAARVSEYFNYMHGSNPAVRIFDHHPVDKCDILDARVEGYNCGANTSALGKLAMERGIRLSPEEATIALAGIYADTGKLIYENVCRDDYEVSAWLLDMGASLRLVKSFLEAVKDDEQVDALNQILRVKTNRVIRGHRVLFSYLELESSISGLAAVVEKIMDVENPDAYFAVFSVPKTKTVFLIARSQKAGIDLHELLSVYGGGGHQLAASAKIKNREGPLFFEEFLSYLETALVPAARAGDIMTADVVTVNEDRTLLETSMLMEESNLSGLPVVSGTGKLTGLIVLKDIMKGRRASDMRAPVKSYMKKNLVSAEASITIREVERIFYKNHITHLPIVEDDKLIGIITRRDYLQYQNQKTP